MVIRASSELALDLHGKPVVVFPGTVDNGVVTVKDVLDAVHEANTYGAPITMRRHIWLGLRPSRREAEVWVLKTRLA